MLPSEGMTQLILFLAIIFALPQMAQSQAGAPKKVLLKKAVNLKCQAAQLQPIAYKASLQGPDKNGEYRLRFAYQYYGATLDYEYQVKRIKDSFIGKKARVYNLVQQKNKTIRLYIETEKDGPVDMICASR